MFRPTSDGEQPDVAEKAHVEARRKRVRSEMWPVGTRSAAAKHACSVATTCAPSPTAAATRLVEPERTSPMANTPRRLVSSGRRLLVVSAPVNTKPFVSNDTPDPDSQSVFGPAPM